MKLENSSSATRSRWLIGPTNSKIEFTVEYLTMTTATGTVQDFTGTIEFDEADPTRSSVEVTLDAASIATDDPSRDTHLRSRDFFDVERFPTITFSSRRVEARGPRHYDVRGDLTIRGVTREADLQVTFQGETGDVWGKRRADFSARTTIHPADFGLGWNTQLTAGWIPVGDHVTVLIQVEAVKAD